MNACLKIGDRLLDGDQIIAALVKYQLLETLVGQVLLDEIIAEFPLTQRELFDALVGSAKIPIPEDFDRFLAQWCQLKNVTPAYLNNVLIRQLQVEKFKQLSFGEQIESEFLRNKSNFDQVEYSLIQLDNLLLAQELYFQLRDDGADFAQLAQQYSLTNDHQTGGRVGPVPLSTLPAEIVTLFRSKPIGTVHEPFAVDDQFWIIRLEQFTAAHLTETTRANLIEQLHSQRLQSQVKTLIATPGAIAYNTQPYSVQEERASVDKALIGGAQS